MNCIGVNGFKGNWFDRNPENDHDPLNLGVGSICKETCVAQNLRVPRRFGSFLASGTCYRSPHPILQVPVQNEGLKDCLATARLSFDELIVVLKKQVKEIKEGALKALQQLTPRISGTNKGQVF